MDQPVHHFSELFEQLGLRSDAESIERFMLVSSDDIRDILFRMCVAYFCFGEFRENHIPDGVE